MADNQDPRRHVGTTGNIPTQAAGPTPDQTSVPMPDPRLNQTPTQAVPKLTKEQKRRRNRKNFRVLVLVLTLVIGLVLGFLIGRAWPEREEISFYAEIVEVDEDNLLVEGIAENDVNHRGQAYLNLAKLDTEGMVQTATDENIPVADLKIGDLVRVTYDGEMLETFPVQIPNVWRIEKTEP